VRIFNMSLNIIQPAAPHRYSAHAARLDQIADANDAIIFISAGNIDPQNLQGPNGLPTLPRHLPISPPHATTNC
jgi:hypothetical protein